MNIHWLKNYREIALKEREKRLNQRKISNEEAQQQFDKVMRTPPKPVGKTYEVLIIESEQGWGSKIDERKYFETEQEAKDFIKSYNDKYNPPGPVPEWYMIAQPNWA